MPFGYGRGNRWNYYATGMMPGWMRGYGRGYWNRGYGNCRFFPGMPRGWWTGRYGNIQLTPTGPQFQQTPINENQQSNQNFKQQEIQALEFEAKELEKELQEINERLKELKEVK